MKTKLLTLFTALSTLLIVLPVAQANAQTEEVEDLLNPRACKDDAPICAGYGESDNTWHVGAGAGQYADKTPQEPLEGAAGGEIDPHNHSLVQKNSYGVQSRLTFRAVVVEDAQGDQVALVKSDNYLAMDALQRRVGQILLLNGSKVSYDEIMHMASHNHYSPMYSTPSWGVWLFQDVFDLRAFEYQAQQMAAAILEAESNLQAAKMGATTIEHKIFKGMVARRTVTDDGTPGGYPLDFGDFGLSVVRFDSLEGAPIATVVNWGMHPEGLEADDLITAEFLAPLERFVHRATGSNVIFGQGDVGSAESGPARPYDATWPAGVPRQWDNAGHAQVERGAFYLARDVIKAYDNIGTGTPSPAPYSSNFVPFTDEFDVKAGNAWIPGPYSHPYPSVSNCRTEESAKGDTGGPITGLPDCDRGGNIHDDYPPDHPFGGQLGQAWDNMEAEGIPLPSHYDAPGFTGVEENLRLHLQAFKLGEVILMSCACEAQVDLILNLETRVDEEQGNQWLGYDWTKRLDCTQAQPPEGDWTCVRRSDDPNPSPRATFDQPLTFTDAEHDKMKAQIYNDARGWDAPENAAQANADPEPQTQEEFDAIWGNFTHEELSADLGYKLPIGVGHAGDYNGYTVSYREYMSYDHYRKALTSYGPHTADYMNSELMELAGELNGAPSDIDPVEAADEARAAADEARQVAWTTALGLTAGAAYQAWTNTLPNDAGPPAATADGQPADITRFQAATFSWRGGSNAVDNPTVVVQRRVDGEWVDFADQSGEVQTKLTFPQGVPEALASYAGTHEWVWTANFEAFNAFPAEIGSTPEGEYRFVVTGVSRQLLQNTPYTVESEPFMVSAWDGLKVQDIRAADNGSVSFTVDSRYPETYQSVFPYVQRHMRGEADRGELKAADIKSWCDTCSFRPWATKGVVTTAAVTVVRADGSTETVPAKQTNGTWTAATDLYEGDRAFVDRGGVVDNYGETNGQSSNEVRGTRTRPVIQEATTLKLKLEGSGAKRKLNAKLKEADGGAVIPGQPIEFYANGVLLGQAQTDANGVALLSVSRKQWKGVTFEARFAGTELYLPSSASFTTAK